jgi:phage shock protein C
MRVGCFRLDAVGVERYCYQRKDLVDTVHDTFRHQGLVRPREGRILGGVCAGLGRRFGLEPWTARLLFVLILFVIPGSQLLMYPILWILMPPQVDPVVQVDTPSSTIPPAAAV